MAEEEAEDHAGRVNTDNFCSIQCSTAAGPVSLCPSPYSCVHHLNSLSICNYHSDTNSILDLSEHLNPITLTVAMFLAIIFLLNIRLSEVKYFSVVTSNNDTLAA